MKFVSSLLMRAENPFKNNYLSKYLKNYNIQKLFTSVIYCESAKLNYYYLLLSSCLDIIFNL